jgi:hypothetical protein
VYPASGSWKLGRHGDSARRRKGGDVLYTILVILLIILLALMIWRMVGGRGTV